MIVPWSSDAAGADSLYLGLTQRELLTTYYDARMMSIPWQQQIDKVCNGVADAPGSPQIGFVIPRRVVSTELSLRKAGRQNAGR